jgi:hypothetical protein
LSILGSKGIFYGNLVHFVVFWYIFSRLGMLYQEKSGSPDLIVIFCEGILEWFWKRATVYQKYVPPENKKYRFYNRFRNTFFIAEIFIVASQHNTKVCGPILLQKVQIVSGYTSLLVVHSSILLCRTIFYACVSKVQTLMI